MTMISKYTWLLPKLPFILNSPLNLMEEKKTNKLIGKKRKEPTDDEEDRWAEMRARSSKRRISRAAMYLPSSSSEFDGSG